MIYHVDDSGRIVAVLAGQTAEQETLAQAAGLRVIEATGQYDREAHVYVDGAFAPAPAPSAAEALATAVADGLRGLAAHFQHLVDQIEPASRYPQFERDSQDAQVLWAKTYETDATAAAMLAALAAPTGQGVAELAARILANKQQWDAMRARLIGLMRPLRAAISAAQTPDEVAAVLAQLPTAAGLQAAMAGQ
ncbi:hypothetical protein [Desulfarculus baarsii]